MASTFTTNLGIEEPSTGDYVNAWAGPVNANYTLLDQAMGTATTVAMTNANVTLTVAQAAFFTVIVIGVLSANVKLILPGTIGGRRNIWNQTTGAFTLTVQNGAGDTGGGVVVGQGFITPVVLTAGRAYYDAYSSTPPGTIIDSVFTNPPPGFLLCYGQAVSRTTYSQLWAAAQTYGWTWGNGDGSTTFNIPDLRGRLVAGADDMGGSAANRLNGYTVGTTGGEQLHILTVPELAAHNHTDAGHTHPINDPSHAHAFGNNIEARSLASASGGTIYLTVSSPSGISTNGAVTGISVTSGTANIQNTGSSAGHNNVQPTAAVNKMIRY